MNYYICEKCGRIGAGQTRVELQEITLPVRGEDITLTTPTRVCLASGDAVFDRELDNETLKRAYDMYRARHDVVSPDEVKELREKYSISQRNLALLLGWSEMTIVRYEKGAVPDRAHSVVLRVLRDPCAMRDLLEKGGNALSGLARQKLRGQLEKLVEQDTPKRRLASLIEGAHTGPDILTGYRRFAPEKMGEMVLFFAQEGVFGTNVNKELWYADFAHYRETTLSISGETYVRNLYGPTMHEYPILDVLCECGELECEETYNDDGTPRGKKYRALRAFDPAVFSPTELEVMNRVFACFKNTSSKEISRLSHEEAGWRDTEQGEMISYEFALLLKAL